MQRMIAGSENRDAAPSQMRRGALEYCVLALLRKDERYALELIQELARSDGMVTSEGTIYPLLSRLRRERLVDTTWRESPSGPPRRYYRLTAAGQRALDRFAEQWRAFANAVDHILEAER